MYHRHNTVRRYWTEGLSYKYIFLTDWRDVNSPTRRARLRGGRSWRRAAAAQRYHVNNSNNY